MSLDTIQPHNARAAATWNAGGADYDRISHSIADSIEHCVTRLAPRAGEHVLDVATGTGWAARRVAERGAKVIGIAGTPSARSPLAFAAGRGIKSRRVPRGVEEVAVAAARCQRPPPHARTAVGLPPFRPYRLMNESCWADTAVAAGRIEGGRHAAVSRRAS